MKNTKVFLLLFVIVTFNSCLNKNKNFFIGNIKTVHFEKEYSVTGEHINVDSIGISSVMVIDKYLITGLYKQEYLTRIYDLKSLDLIGDFFRKGQGPSDFGFIRIIKTQYPYIWIDDSRYNNLKLIDLEETVKFRNREIAIKNTLKYKNVVEPLRTFHISDTCLLIKSYDAAKGLYYLKYNPVTGKSIDGSEVIMYNYPITSEIVQTKMLTLADCMKPDGSKIASVTGMLDQIDILDITHPNKSISVTANNFLYDYKYVEYTDSEEMKEFYFSYPYCSNNFIFALYRNNKNNNVELHIIDWNGNPFCKLVLDRDIRVFSIDFGNGFMYGVSDMDEKIYRYDISRIFK